MSSRRLTIRLTDSGKSGKIKNSVSRGLCLLGNEDVADSQLGVANGKCETLRDGETRVFLCEPETF